MRISVASGKGGTGKTTIATSIALSLAADRKKEAAASCPPLFLDCDVEAPNAHLFLKPNIEHRKDVGILIPQVDESRCTHCGKCAEVCQYHAIAVVGKQTMVFPQLCHGCGSCALICPQKAITETLEVIGTLERGTASAGICFARGVLNVGEPMAVPVIRQLKKWINPQPEQAVIIDASPGTSCPVVEAMRGADFVLLVTEPTPYGLHDLKLAVQVAEELQLPVGVIINRDGIGDSSIDVFCRSNSLPILMRIPYERIIAEEVARGRTLVETLPEYKNRFQEMCKVILSDRFSLDPRIFQGEIRCS